MALSASLGGCHSIETWNNDFYGNFDALWTILDEHYCFFESKNIDWKATGERYRAAIDPEWDDKQFFNHCAAMLDELKDGHTNLISWFNVSYYRNWWSDYPQNFNLRLIQEHYLDFNYFSGGGMIYKLLEDRNVGYMYYASFSSSFGDSFLDEMLYSMRETDGLIIDVRDNGGGDMTNVERLVSRFLSEEICAGYISHKTGPGHKDFSEPFAYYYSPAENHVRWLKPVIVLTNRSTFSAANNFVSVMKNLPNVAIVGSVTGGGSGMPFSSELPCGWGRTILRITGLRCRHAPHRTRRSPHPRRRNRHGYRPRDQRHRHNPRICHRGTQPRRRRQRRANPHPRPAPIITVNSNNYRQP